DADVPLLRHVLPGHSAPAPLPRARVRDAAVARRRPDARPAARRRDARPVARPHRLPARVGRRRRARCAQDVRAEARRVTAFAATRAHLLFERNLMVYRRTWLTIVSGFFEPIFYLF